MSTPDPDMVDRHQYQIALDTRDRVILERDRYLAEVVSLRRVLETAEGWQDTKLLSEEARKRYTAFQEAIASHRALYPHG